MTRKISESKKFKGRELLMAQAVLFEEGGAWVRWEAGEIKRPVFAVRFENGMIWDVVAGWRGYNG